MGFKRMIEHCESNIPYGLKYRPSFHRRHLDQADGSPDYNHYLEMQGEQLYHGELGEWTDSNNEVMEKIIQENPDAKLIVEIGVDRSSRVGNGAGPDKNVSSTMTILANKSKDTYYLGIDLDDKSYLANVDENIYTLRCNSHQQDLVRKVIDQLGFSHIDILFIDGWHSIDTVINDWLYIDILAPKGIVMFHDIQHHPGPREVFEAIDEKMFNKEKLCMDTYGVGIARCQRYE